MARVSVPVTQFTRAGTLLPAATAGDATNGHSVANGGGDIGLIVKNIGASSRNITFYAVRTIDGLAAPTRIEAVAAGETQLFGPFNANDYGTTLTFDVAHADLTINAVRIG